jgi:hypothetical protein
MQHALNHLMYREVDVDAVSGVVTGVLREVTDRHVTLWTRRGWVSIAHERIKGVRPARKSTPPTGQAGGRPPD